MSVTQTTGWTVQNWIGFWANPDPAIACKRVPTIVRRDVAGYWPATTEPVRGAEAYLQRVLDLLAFVPDLRLTLEEHATNGDSTFVRWTGRGTAPNGPFHCNGVDRIRLLDGLVIENRIISDHAIFRDLAAKLAAEASARHRDDGAAS
jgi:hypothetical protein